jgi:hypothetical protein
MYMKPVKYYFGFVLFTLAIGLLFSFRQKNIEGKDLVGAWGYGPENNRTVMIVTDNVFSVATYDIPAKKFIQSYGGTWKVNGSKLVQTIEWNSADSTAVGKELTKDVVATTNKLSVTPTGETWSRLDNGKPGALMGAWVITGNYTNDKVSKRASPFYPRRTMKMLSGKYFQWVAYNVATKSFMNAGGGSYTTKDGKYSESIEFFTKTPESVGKALQFDYSFVDGDWRHKGQKSTGGALDECWTRRSALETK